VSPDRKGPIEEPQDHGILDEAGIDTTAISILGTRTAQVRVTLPQGREDEDDDVVDDHPGHPYTGGDIRSGGIVIELPSDDPDDDDDVTAGELDETFVARVRGAGPGDGEVADAGETEASGETDAGAASAESSDLASDGSASVTGTDEADAGLGDRLSEEVDEDVRSDGESAESLVHGAPGGEDAHDGDAPDADASEDAGEEGGAEPPSIAAADGPEESGVVSGSDDAGDRPGTGTAEAGDPDETAIDGPSAAEKDAVGDSDAGPEDGAGIESSEGVDDDAPDADDVATGGDASDADAADGAETGADSASSSIVAAGGPEESGVADGGAGPDERPDADAAEAVVGDGAETGAAGSEPSGDRSEGHDVAAGGEPSRAGDSGAGGGTESSSASDDGAPEEADLLSDRDATGAVVAAPDAEAGAEPSTSADDVAPDEDGVVTGRRTGIADRRSDTVVSDTDAAADRFDEDAFDAGAQGDAAPTEFASDEPDIAPSDDESSGNDENEAGRADGLASTELIHDGAENEDGAATGDTDAPGGDEAFAGQADGARTGDDAAVAEDASEAAKATAGRFAETHADGRSAAADPGEASDEEHAAGEDGAARADDETGEARTTSHGSDGEPSEEGGDAASRAGSVHGGDVPAPGDEDGPADAIADGSGGSETSEETDADAVRGVSADAVADVEQPGAAGDGPATTGDDTGGDKASDDEPSEVAAAEDDPASSGVPSAALPAGYRFFRDRPAAADDATARSEGPESGASENEPAGAGPHDAGREDAGPGDAAGEPRPIPADDDADESSVAVSSFAEPTITGSADAEPGTDRGADEATQTTEAEDMTDPTPESPVTKPVSGERPSFVQQARSRSISEVSSSAARESADVLTADRLLDRSAVHRPEPEGPWRRLVYTLSGHLINLGESKRTRARKELIARIAVPLAGEARFVPVLSRKGGVGKTTVTALIGMALADGREDRVIAVDANPDRGTLAERIDKPQGRTVRDLVRGRDRIRGYADMSAHVVRDETRLDVLASDRDPHVSEAFSDGDYRQVADVAAHYYSIVMTDTGTGIVHSVMGATLDLADQLIVVTGQSVDEARLASETLTWLESNGYAEKAQNALVVLNQSSPGSPLVRLEELESHFRTRVRNVVRLPYDAGLATGSAITFADLAPATRAAAREAAAHVVEGLRRGEGQRDARS
jgi:MinD-like ATPase involved in chromosome partitioning or flagellar assembly